MWLVNASGCRGVRGKKWVARTRRATHRVARLGYSIRRLFDPGQFFVHLGDRRGGIPLALDVLADRPIDDL